MKRTYVCNVPPTSDVGSYKTNCSSSYGRTFRQDALWHYNSCRAHDGLPPVSRMPAGTRYEFDPEAAILKGSQRRIPIRCASGIHGECRRLRQPYHDFEEFEDYCRNFNLHERLGFDRPADAWEADPVIESSVDPLDYRLAVPIFVR